MKSIVIDNRFIFNLKYMVYISQIALVKLKQLMPFLFIFMLIGIKVNAQNNSVLISKNFPNIKTLYGLYSVGLIKDSVNNKKLSIGGFLNFEYSPDPNKNWFSGATLIMPFKFQFKKLYLYTGACIDYNIEKYTLNNQYTSNKIERIGPGLYLGLGYNFYKKFNIYTDCNFTYSYRKEVNYTSVNIVPNRWIFYSQRFLSITLSYKF